MNDQKTNILKAVQAIVNEYAIVVADKRECILYDLPIKLRNIIQEFCNDKKFKYTLENTNTIVIKDINCIDFLSFSSLCGTKLSSYKRMLGYTDSIPTCKILKTHKNAVLPHKHRVSDEGYDMHIISVDKQFDKYTTLYNTHIKIKPPPGWHVEILPRSSLSKSGYMLSNSVGLIDENYRGDIKIALTKINSEAEDLKLPFKAVQMILRKSTHFLCEEVKELDETSRGVGGFGSTDLLNKI